VCVSVSVAARMCVTEGAKTCLQLNVPGGEFGVC
jgi:hypothetical protein